MGGKPRLPQPKRERPYKSPLDRAAGFEVIWQHVSALFEVARQIANASFVYVIAEEDGPIKIGSAVDPILRLRSLQTGNPRRLRVEHVLLGDADLERLLHELWEPFAIKSARVQRRQRPDAAPGTEWFTADIRTQLEPILETAAEEQVALVARTEESLAMEDLERVVRDAHWAHGHKPTIRDQPRLLAAGAGYIVRRPSRI